MGTIIEILFWIVCSGIGIALFLTYSAFRFGSLFVKNGGQMWTLFEDAYPKDDKNIEVVWCDPDKAHTTFRWFKRYKDRYSAYGCKPLKWRYL